MWTELWKIIVMILPPSEKRLIREIQIFKLKRYVFFFVNRIKSGGDSDINYYWWFYRCPFRFVICIFTLFSRVQMCFFLFAFYKKRNKNSTIRLESRRWYSKCAILVGGRTGRWRTVVRHWTGKRNLNIVRNGNFIR